MPAATQPGRPAAAPRRGCYVYGIVPHDVEPAPGAKGVGDPPARVQVVRHGGIAALVSEIDLALYRSKTNRTGSDLGSHKISYAAWWYSLITPPSTFRRRTGTEPTAG